MVGDDEVLKTAFDWMSWAVVTCSDGPRRFGTVRSEGSNPLARPIPSNTQANNCGPQSAYALVMGTVTMVRLHGFPTLSLALTNRIAAILSFPRREASSETVTVSAHSRRA